MGPDERERDFEKSLWNTRVQSPFCLQELFTEKGRNPVATHGQAGFAACPRPEAGVTAFSKENEKNPEFSAP